MKRDRRLLNGHGEQFGVPTKNDPACSESVSAYREREGREL